VKFGENKKEKKKNPQILGCFKLSLLKKGRGTEGKGHSVRKDTK